ncbi:hypothetical protein FPV67DRAFT_1480084 [Lyophyllum atratum]|nr:hypothetical protein FPV67DRAFT_1480084 [Lyophyllum atratum]
MAPHDDLLRTICQSEETLKEAQAVFRLAQQKTGAGSGFELGPHRTGLPAICAYIASKGLNNNDVTRKNAQVASCLKATDFDKAHQTVEAAIAGTRKTKRPPKVSYEKLVSEYAPTLDRKQFHEWTAAANRALIQSDDKFNSDDPLVKYAIFYWAYNAATSKNLMTQQEFAAEQEISLKIFNRLLNKVTRCCSSVKARIQNDIKAQRSPAKPAMTPRRSPKKPTRILPTRDSPAKRKADEAPPSEHESDAEVVDALLPETPSKKRKAESSTKSAHPASPRKSIFPPVASSSRVTLDTHAADEDPSPQAPAEPSSRSQPEVIPMDVDDDTNNPPAHRDESNDGHPPTRRRFRPVYADHRQWYALDRRVKRIWKQAERYKKHMVELHGHPLEALRA